MDIFKFHNPTAQTKMEQGEIVNGLTSKMWVERYGKNGEFTLVGYASSGLRDELPEGTFISHVDTDVIMTVEDHEINSTKDREAMIKITGRSYEQPILENRISEPPRAYPFVDGTQDYEQPTEEAHWQIVNFINGLIDPGHVYYAADGITWISVYSWIPDGVISAARFVRHGRTAIETISEWLAAEGYSLKVIRPGPLTRTSGVIPDENTVIAVINGVDRTDTAVLSFDLGEIEQANYFWSSRPKKTVGIVHSKWLGVRSGTPETGINKRAVFVDASGLDNNLNAAPTGATLTNLQNGMSKRGLDVVTKSKASSILDVQVSKEGTHLVYRKDYGIGDIIMVQGEYNATAPFRVSEYVEIEDENGMGGYPTLVVP